MDVERMGSDLERLACCGVVLSVEQKTQLQSSLVILQNKCKFSRVQLWGVVRGVSGDYFIAVGLGKDELGDRKYLYRWLASSFSRILRVLYRFKICSLVRTANSGPSSPTLTEASEISVHVCKVVSLGELSTFMNRI